MKLPRRLFGRLLRLFLHAMAPLAPGGYEAIHGEPPPVIRDQQAARPQSAKRVGVITAWRSAVLPTFGSLPRERAFMRRRRSSGR
jgi:hypothetical protein